MSVPYMEGCRLAVLILVAFVKASFVFDDSSTLALQLLAPGFTFVMTTLLVIQIYLKVPYLGAGTTLANSIEAGIFGVAAASNVVLIVNTVLSSYNVGNARWISSMLALVLFPSAFTALYRVTLPRASAVDDFELLQSLIDLPTEDSLDCPDLIATSALCTLLLQSRVDVQELIVTRLRAVVLLQLPLAQVLSCMSLISLIVCLIC